MNNETTLYKNVGNILQDQTQDIDMNEIIADMKYNDQPAWHELCKVLLLYKRNLAERIMDGRQTNLTFMEEWAT